MSPSRDPLAVLRTELTAARERGESFAEAWPPARRAAMAVATGGIMERAAWTTALAATRNEWQRCFEGTPGCRRLHHLRTAIEA